MPPRRRKGPREKDLTGRYLSGNYDEDRAEPQQRFTDRSKNAQQNKILKTAALQEERDPADIDALPAGQVLQVYSLYSEVEHDGQTYLCTVRKTLTKVSDTAIVVGDRVKFRPAGTFAESGQPEAVIERILPRQTILTRADSFKGQDQHPIVANAQQMLIVASLREPRVKWGLVDRMLVAARAGGLVPIVCLNKIDLLATDEQTRRESAAAEQVMQHYQSLGYITLETSAEQKTGLDSLKLLLKDRVTVLAGHSGVGKSSLIRAIQPSLDIRVGEVSRITEKGRHTTTSARHYPLDFGGAVIDTPGVKLFGLWAVTRDNLADYFPDVAADAAPQWRRESYARIESSLGNSNDEIRNSNQ